MRNLKKLLALVLAMMMAFSLMVTANAANPVRDYPDADQADEAFEEAIDVLTGMKVYSGDNGNFKPADTITRAEVAALIYRLATGDVDDAQAGLYAIYGNFPDVAHDAWYAGYVGYCANAGYIKGRSNGNFDPAGNVTGYEALAMILRAIGYDKNGEFTGATWQTEVSALSQQLGILDNVKTTQYGGTLYLAARRDVVADLLFRADAYVNMVQYTPAFGYQPYGQFDGVAGSTRNMTLGQKIFGLSWNQNGVVLGNQQTGEDYTIMGYAGQAEKDDQGRTILTGATWSQYTWAGSYDYDVVPFTVEGATAQSGDTVTLGENWAYTLETGIDLVGHRLKLWYDGGFGTASKSDLRTVYAYFDKADTDVVYADNTNLTANSGNDDTELAEAIGGTDLKVAPGKTAVFNNSFGLFGTLDATAANAACTGDGKPVTGANTDAASAAYVSPVGLYEIIDNNGDGYVDAVIALNIESSQITESNNVNRVPTIGVPVQNVGDDTPAEGTEFVQGDASQGADENVKDVNNVLTGVIAQAALVGNSAKALGEYEMGIHITGTTPRSPGSAEKQAINGTDDPETAYFLLNKVTATVEGTVVAYNRFAGTVTLDNGTVLERSKFYDTVVITNPADGSAPNKVDSSTAPISAIPQGWVYDSGVQTVAGSKTDLVKEWVEGYANTTYKFYTDYEGKYLGAERTYGASFLYGTYLDYEQKTSSSTFNYYLTGVTLNGEIETKQVSKFWKGGAALTATTGLTPITGTDDLSIPFRDTANSNGNINGIGEGIYHGFAISGDIVDGLTSDTNTNRSEYLNNMARLGVKYGADAAVGAFASQIDIGKDEITLGAVETATGTGKYLTEATKFILVEGFGTDSVKAEVYDGISELRGSSEHVFLNMTDTVYDEDDWPATPPTATEVRMPNITEDTVMNQMTYYTESAYTYAQSGATDKKIDVIILPKAAVSWSGGSGLYYVGDPNYTMINSWGTDAWKYNLYLDGELRQVWLTNDPNGDTTAQSDYNLTADTFLNLKDTGEVANDGQPIYTAGSYSVAGVWQPGTYVTANADPKTGVGDANQYTMTSVVYSAVTRDAQTATFTDPDDTTSYKLYRVAGAKVVNLNAKENCIKQPDNGYIWPGITDLTTLNEAGSINPVTGRALRVSAVVDPDHPLVVTTIYVCYEQIPVGP